MISFNKFKFMMIGAAAAALVACGGSDTPYISLKGVAATGAAMANADVTVVCNSLYGTGTVTSTAKTDANGNYTVSAANGKPACLVTASQTVGGVTTTLRSVALSEGVVNVTPVTNMVVVALAAAKGAPDLNSLISPAYAPTTANVTSAQTVVLTAINSALAAQGKPTLAAGTDLLTDANFKVGSTVDTALDNLATIGAITNTGTATTTLQNTINTNVDATVDPNPTGATGGSTGGV